MIQRFFHPVGQGAFYSERHTLPNSTFNIVYDCGTAHATKEIKKIKNLVTQSFDKTDIVNILFISHLDFDHISLIDTLKNTVSRIERVVLPLLYNKDKQFLSNIFLAIGERGLSNFVLSPNDYFGHETQIITVRPSLEEEINNDPIDISELSESREISSGTPLRPTKSYEWVFIPTNHMFLERKEEFINELKKKGISYEQLRIDPNYLDQPIGKSTVRNEIKSIYESLSGGINVNSMCLYSGPYKNPSHRHYRIRKLWHNNLHCCNICCDWWYPFPKDRVACLYTGDSNLNVLDLRKKYEKYWGLIGTIQIPHHGSLRSFNTKILTDKEYICPISVGKNSQYGHPSQKVISHILYHRSYPILVTEDANSTFVEEIE
jgi:hypothetical protein